MRTLRFKEITPGIDDWLAPAEVHRSIADDSLTSGPFRRRGTAEGFLSTGNERPDATRNLVLLGGSFVESMFSPEDKRFASVLERHLASEWSVLNGGYSGMTTLHALSQLAAKIAPHALGSSRLVYFVPMSDSSALATSALYWAGSKTVTPIVPAVSSTPPPWDRREAAARLIGALIATAQALGIELAVIASPYRDGDFSTDVALRALYKEDRVRYARARWRFELLREVARNECAARSVPFLDAQDILDDPALYYDQMHLNEQGQGVFAAKLLRWLSPLLESEAPWSRPISDK